MSSGAVSRLEAARFEIRHEGELLGETKEPPEPAPRHRDELRLRARGELVEHGHRHAGRRRNVVRDAPQELRRQMARALFVKARFSRERRAGPPLGGHGGTSFVWASEQPCGSEPLCTAGVVPSKTPQKTAVTREQLAKPAAWRIAPTEAGAGRLARPIPAAPRPMPASFGQNGGRGVRTMENTVRWSTGTRAGRYRPDSAMRSEANTVRPANSCARPSEAPCACGGQASGAERRAGIGARAGAGADHERACRSDRWLRSLRSSCTERRGRRRRDERGLVREEPPRYDGLAKPRPTASTRSRDTRMGDRMHWEWLASTGVVLDGVADGRLLDECARLLGDVTGLDVSPLGDAYAVRVRLASAEAWSLASAVARGPRRAVASVVAPAIARAD